MICCRYVGSCYPVVIIVVIKSATKRVSVGPAKDQLRLGTVRVVRLLQSIYLVLRMFLAVEILVVNL